MTECSRGDVVLVRVGLPGHEEPSLRPAVVLATETYRLGRGQLVVAAVTSSQPTPMPGDTVLRGWREAGLLDASVATGVLLTVSQASAERRLGSLTAEDLQAVEASLRLGLGL